MFRRVVCLVLVPFVLLPHAAQFGHCHGDEQPAGHDHRPHFHLGHHRVSESPQPEPGLAPQSAPLSDHDDDAVYLSTDAVTPRDINDNVEPAGTPWALVSLPVTALVLLPPEHAAAWPQPPPPLACPLFLRHLAILV